MSHSGLSCRKAAVEPIDHRLEAVLRYAVAIGAVLVLLLPAARGVHAAIGWLPLWLLAMPLTAWWALRRFARPSPAVLNGRPSSGCGHAPFRRRDAVPMRPGAKDCRARPELVAAPARFAARDFGHGGGAECLC